MPGHAEQLWHCSNPPAKAAPAGARVELLLAGHWSARLGCDHAHEERDSSRAATSFLGTAELCQLRRAVVLVQHPLGRVQEQCWGQACSRQLHCRSHRGDATTRWRLKREQTLLRALWVRRVLERRESASAAKRRLLWVLWRAAGSPPQPSRQRWEGMVLPGQTPALAQPPCWEHGTAACGAAALQPQVLP